MSLTGAVFCIQAAFLEKTHHPKLGLEILAIVYSLPYAILMWG